MRVLAITKIFPNCKEPSSAPFNRQQFAALGRLCDVEVLATIPWFPGASAFGRWSSAGRLGEVPSEEVIDGLRVSHPRFAFLPRAGHSIGGPLYAASLLPSVLRRRGAVDVVLGAWAYPDGFAAVSLARVLGVPSVLKLHGSDINVLGKRPMLRPGIRWTLRNADRVVAVSHPLAEAAVALGARADRIEVVLNGVDRALFSPRDRAAARRALGHEAAGRWLLYVGRLEEAKGVVDLVKAFARVVGSHPDWTLVLVGDGGARTECEALAASFRSQVIFAGAQPHAEVPRWMAACDMLTLPSWNEGTPNVVLEALAAGRRVVASRVGGIPAVVRDDALGVLVPPRDPGSLAAAIEQSLGRDYDADEVAARSGCSGWEESARKLHGVLRAAIDSWPRAVQKDGVMTADGLAGASSVPPTHPSGPTQPEAS